MLTLIASGALAQGVVHHELTADEATRQVSTDAGLARELLVPVTLSTLLRGRSPVVSGAATLVPCGGAVTAAELREAAQRAQGRILSMDDDGAIREVDAARARFGCLREPAVAADLARLVYLRGVALVDLGQTDAAALDFAEARALDPATQWDTATFGSMRADVFDASAAAPPVTLRVLPAPSEGVLTLDGAPFPGGLDGLLVSPGLHVVQWSPSMASFALLVAGDATLLVPAAATDDLARWAGDAVRGTALIDLLDALGSSDIAFVAVPEATWRREGDGFTLLRAHTAAVVLTPAERRQRTARQVRVGGLLASGAGVVLGGLGYGVALGAAGWADDPDLSRAPSDAYASAQDRHRAGTIVFAVGASVAAGGVVATGSSFWIGGGS